MADKTAGIRVKRYRSAQKNDRRIHRAEVQVPVVARADIHFVGERYRAAQKRARDAQRHLDFVLGTINAPRPKPIDGETLVQCLLTERPAPEWRPHIEAFFDEVSVESIHDLVLAKVFTFEDLYRAARTWRVTDGRAIPWVREMADLALARPAA
ncbi:hypothetical protein [Azospirillum sp. TSO22-1]|uniref:hypothetical protein n=1 Tax=Azospirillum sp. TSO22-1 TaxID=716789 RepID=UPI000D612477|nr:hypothetical protein [Azospirillum sp. TSO22-1]PWC41753.1 hypothetical protein TSO221_22890 [Azospirillum sp. TSO22-1]